MSRADYLEQAARAERLAGAMDQLTKDRLRTYAAECRLKADQVAR